VPLENIDQQRRWEPSHLLGKFINVSDINNQKLIQNKEAVGLMGSIG
jgi:hypothetical protein